MSRGGEGLLELSGRDGTKGGACCKSRVSDTEDCIMDVSVRDEVGVKGPGETICEEL